MTTGTSWRIRRTPTDSITQGAFEGEMFYQTAKQKIGFTGANGLSYMPRMNSASVGNDVHIPNGTLLGGTNNEGNRHSLSFDFSIPDVVRVVNIETLMEVVRFNNALPNPLALQAESLYDYGWDSNSYSMAWTMPLENPEPIEAIAGTGLINPEDIQLADSGTGLTSARVIDTSNPLDQRFVNAMIGPNLFLFKDTVSAGNVKVTVDNLFYPTSIHHQTSIYSQMESTDPIVITRGYSFVSWVWDLARYAATGVEIHLRTLLSAASNSTYSGQATDYQIKVKTPNETIYISAPIASRSRMIRFTAAQIAKMLLAAPEDQYITVYYSMSSIKATVSNQPQYAMMVRPLDLSGTVVNDAVYNAAGTSDKAASLMFTGANYRSYVTKKPFVWNQSIKYPVIGSRPQQILFPVTMDKVPTFEILNSKTVSGRPVEIINVTQDDVLFRVPDAAATEVNYIHWKAYVRGPL
jgi:hypothetical protein